MNRISISLLICLVFNGSIAAEIIKVEKIDEGVKVTEAREKSSGKKLWQSKLSISQIDFDGQPFVYLEDIGQGKYGPGKNEVTWHTTSYIRRVGDQLVPYQVKVIFRDKQGKVIKKLEKHYNSEAKKVICLSKDGERKFDFKPDLIDREIFGIVLRNFPFEDKEGVELHLLTHEPIMYKISMKNKGKELVEGVECYKLEMAPDLGALSIFGAFVPKTYFWYTVEEPRQFVRYEGLESGLGTPYIILEPQKGG